MTRHRLSPEKRRAQILRTALQVFTDKGYRNTTMHDLVQATGLSAGGLYHYYKSTSEILRDLMREGCYYRDTIVENQLQQETEPIRSETLARILVDKILDDNPYMPVYVMFLKSMQEDEGLRKLYLELKEENISHYRKRLKAVGYKALSEQTWNLISELINTFILGAESLKNRSILQSNRALLENFIVQIAEADRKEAMG